MSFSEGFTQGFNMVDGALQKRNANVLEQQKQDRAEAHYNDALTRQGTQDAQALKWHDDAAGLAATATTYAHGRDTAKDVFDTQTQTDTRTHYADMVGLQKQSNAISQTNANNSALEHKSAIALNNYKLQDAKDTKEKSDSLERAQTYMHQNADGTMAITLPKGREKEALKDFNVGFGINISSIASNIDQHQSDVNILQSAMTNEAAAFSKQNMPTVLESLNRIEAVDIKKGSGLQADGKTTITNKKIVGIHDIDGSGNLVFDIESTGTKKGDDGKLTPYSNIAPMTQFRSSDTNDKALKTVNRQQFMQRLEGQNYLGKILEVNPEFTQQVADFHQRSLKKEDANWKTIKGENNESSLYNTKTHELITVESAAAKQALSNSIKPAPQEALDYLVKHPEAKDQFIKQFGYSPN